MIEDRGFYNFPIPIQAGGVCHVTGESFRFPALFFFFFLFFLLFFFVGQLVCKCLSFVVDDGLLKRNNRRRNAVARPATVELSPTPPPPITEVDPDDVKLEEEVDHLGSEGDDGKELSFLLLSAA